MWDKLEAIKNHLTSPLARILLWEVVENRAEVLVPDSPLTHYIYIYDDMAQLTVRVNSITHLPIRECTLTPDGEIILN